MGGLEPMMAILQNPGTHKVQVKPVTSLGDNTQQGQACLWALLHPLPPHGTKEGDDSMPFSLDTNRNP